VIRENCAGARRAIETVPFAGVPTGMNLKSMTLGVDIGDKKSNYCQLDPEGKIVREGNFKTSREAVLKFFAELPSGLLPSRFAHIWAG